MIILKDKVIPVKIHLPKSYYGKPLYEITEDLYIPFTDEHVPEGFVSDGATVFRILWWLFPPVSTYFLPAVIHDFYLSTNKGWVFSNDALIKAMRIVDVHPTVIKLFKAFTKLYAKYRIRFRGDLK